MARANFLDFLLVGIGLLAMAIGADASVRERFEQTVDFNAGGIFTIENQYGSVEIEVGSGGSVRIEAEKEAESEEALRALEIAIEGSGDRVSVRTVPHNGRGTDGVSYRILLPAEAQVQVSTSNGDVSVRGLQGRVEAESVNGALELEDVAGEIRAETTNGNISASYRRLEAGRHRFETINGAVRVHLPADAGGDLDAKTMNGSIDVDFPANLTHSSEQQVQGTFGSGSGSVEISTVNGSVSIVQN